MVLIPSFEVEKKTEAFNKYIAFFIALISMFTVGVGIMAAYAFISYYLGLVYDHMIFYVFVPVVIFVILAYKLYQFLTALLVSYKFADGKLIRGRIVAADKVSISDVAFQLGMTVEMFKNIGKDNNVTTLKAITDYKNIIDLIKLNTHEGFAERFFDTDLYKKKELFFFAV